MSSRVEQQQQQKRMEQERMQKASDKAARQSARDASDQQNFGQLMKQQGSQQAQQQAGQTKKKDEKQTAAKKGEAKKGVGDQKAQEASRNARLARGGALHQSRVMQQAESFHSMLNNKKAEVEQQSAVLTREAEEGRVEVKEGLEERITDLETQTEEKRELNKKQDRMEASKKGKHNAAIDGDAGAGAGDEGHQGDNRDGSAAKALGKKGEAAPAEQVQGAAGAKQLPAEVIEALVKAVMVGVNAEGQQTFRIELQDGVLQGGTLEVTADRGKVGLHISGVDDNARRLLQASEGALARGLEKRGLLLDSLSVS